MSKCYYYDMSPCIVCEKGVLFEELNELQHLQCARCGLGKMQFAHGHCMKEVVVAYNKDNAVPEHFVTECLRCEQETEFEGYGLDVFDRSHFKETFLTNKELFDAVKKNKWEIGNDIEWRNAPWTCGPLEPLGKNPRYYEFFYDEEGC